MAMLRNWSELLSPVDIEQIHNTSMKLLANVGVRFPEDEAIAVFKKHGIKTNGYIVYPSEERVMSALSTAPSHFTLHARNPERNVTIGNGETVFAPGYGAPFLIELEASSHQGSTRGFSMCPSWFRYAGQGAAPTAE
jgi:trimethylamine--corrinoid protein Co-methyltransferase